MIHFTYSHISIIIARIICTILVLRLPFLFFFSFFWLIETGSNEKRIQLRLIIELNCLLKYTEYGMKIIRLIKRIIIRIEVHLLTRKIYQIYSIPYRNNLSPLWSFTNCRKHGTNIENKLTILRLTIGYSILTVSHFKFSKFLRIVNPSFCRS